MAVRLERKLFTIFKWVLILLPFLILLTRTLGDVIGYIRFTKIFSGESYSAVAEEYANTLGGSLVEDNIDYNPINNTYFTDNFKSINEGLNRIFKIKLRYGTTDYSIDLFNAIAFKVGIATGNYSNTLTGLNDYRQSGIYCVMSYLTYVTFIEVIFMVLYMFRFFIHFFINLFERKEDIVK